MTDHKARKVTTGLPTNGPQKPLAIDCSCGWSGVLHSRLTPGAEEEARKEWEEHRDADES